MAWPCPLNGFCQAFQTYIWYGPPLPKWFCLYNSIHSALVGGRGSLPLSRRSPSSLSIVTLFPFHTISPRRASSLVQLLSVLFFFPSFDLLLSCSSIQTCLLSLSYHRPHSRHQHHPSHSFG
ncbi:hypothetical protein BJX99DRAFT_224518 [Aspergillus californicus]